MAEQKKQRHMAQNIYSNPVLRGTSGAFDGFSIDFRGVKTPLSTYWSLCNFGMDLTEFKKKYPDARGGGAYAGLQNTVIGRKAILSFWETFYDGDKQRHIAKRVFPGGKEHLFGGEGDGTNMIAEYLWKDNVWYRMVLRSWTDGDARTGMKEGDTAELELSGTVSGQCRFVAIVHRGGIVDNVVTCAVGASADWQYEEAND